MPRTKLVINLAPADVRKTGTAFDLPIAIGILLSSEQIIDLGKLNDYMRCKKQFQAAFFICVELKEINKIQNKMDRKSLCVLYLCKDMLLFVKYCQQKIQKSFQFD